MAFLVRTKLHRPRSFAHRAGEFFILNATLWTWLIVGTNRGLPLQLLIFTAGALTMLGWEHLANKRRERADRLAHGLCPSCGYDLQESIMRCPECGATVPAGHVTRTDRATALERVQ